jgi:hypothetical protein
MEQPFVIDRYERELCSECGVEACTDFNCQHLKREHHFNDETTADAWCGALGCKCQQYEQRDS